MILIFLINNEPNKYILKNRTKEICQIANIYYHEDDKVFYFKDTVKLAVSTTGVLWIWFGTN